MASKAGAGKQEDLDEEEEVEVPLHPVHIDCYEFDDDEAARLSEEAIGDKLTDWYVDEKFGGIDAVYFDGLQPPQGALPADLIQWKRLGKMQVAGVDAPILFHKQEGKGIVVGTLEQGQLNDKWLTNAIAAIATQPKLLETIFVSSKYRSKGLYTVKLFKDGMWHYMHIDDRIPVDISGEPIYAKGQNRNETWIMLLEKAYAKLHGCYEALATGYVDEALRDLTGGAPLYIDTKVAQGKRMREDDKLWSFLKSSLSDDAVVTAVRSPQAPIPEGGLAADPTCRVLGGCAYVVKFMSIVEDPLTKLKTKIVRVYNPWGLRTWGGKWSAHSVQWEDYPKMRVQLENMLPTYKWGEDDGTFLMTFEDFVEQFDTLGLLFTTPDEWLQERFQGEWLEGSTVSGPGGAPTAENTNTFTCNPQYGFSLNNEAEVHVVLAQKDTRWQRGKPDYDGCPLGFVVCALTDPHLRVHAYWRSKVKNPSPAWSKTRQVSERFTLPPGNYAIVPCTFGRNVVADFFLDLLVSQPADIFDSNEEEDAKSVVPDDEGKKESEDGAAAPIAAAITDLQPDDENLVDLTLRAMQRTVSRLGISARDLKTEINELEMRTAKLEGKH
jgi:hypothetical protein